MKKLTKNNIYLFPFFTVVYILYLFVYKYLSVFKRGNVAAILTNVFADSIAFNTLLVKLLDVDLKIFFFF